MPVMLFESVLVETIPKAVVECARVCVRLCVMFPTTQRFLCGRSHLCHLLSPSRSLLGAFPSRFWSKV